MSPKYSQGAASQSQPSSGRSRADRGPAAPANAGTGLCRASICLGLGPPARSGPSRPHRLEMMVPVTLLLPQAESIKAFVGAKCMQAVPLPCR